MQFHINALYLMMIIYSMFHNVSYSVYNIIFLLFTYQTPTSRWHYFAMNNTIGLTLTWYWAIFLDPSLPSRMISKYNWSLPKFILGDILIHFIPFIYSIYNISKYQNQNQMAQQDPIILHSGIYTLFTNLLWSHINFDTFDVSAIYVHQSTQTWNIIWLGNAIFHFLPMLLIKH